MEDVYLSAEDAFKELARRRGLRRSVEASWSVSWMTPPPIPLRGEVPTAVFARHVATARYEDLVFDMLARRAGFLPVWPELAGDRFSRRSAFKRSLVHRHVCAGRGRAGGWRLRRDDFPCDFESCDGKRLCDIATNDGETLLAFHHAVQDRFLPGAVRCDVSTWLHVTREAGLPMSKARDYYRVALSLYIAHNVLFEDFHGGESGVALDDFTQTVFEPARAELIARYGVSPLIVRMPWRPEFAYYPANLDWKNHGVVPDDLLPFSA